VLGTEYLTGLLPDILASCAAPRHFEREGNLLLFKFLPLAMEDEVQVLLFCALISPCLCAFKQYFRQCFKQYFK
jgi:hypothetical protein